MPANSVDAYGKKYDNSFSPETMADRKRRAAQIENFTAQFNTSPWAAQMSNQFGGVDQMNSTGYDIFDPNSKIQYTAQQDVASLQPLPQGRFFDPAMNTQESMLTAEQIKAFREDPERFKNETKDELQAEQSLVDRGKTMMQKLFDIEDEKDFELFGVDLGIVETVWDGAWGILKGVENTKNILLGGAISAMPGGLDTLSYDELSGGNDIGDVLMGRMKDDTAPTPMQIAIASIAEESKRIREGGARATDVLLLNPFTAPFILAGIMEEDSPLQEDGFDFLDDAQRTEAFSEGYEKFFSGLGDASLLFADPLIGVGVTAKIARKGALGLRGSRRDREYMAVASQQSSRNIIALNDEVRRGVERVGQAWDADVALRPDDLRDRSWQQLSPDEQYAYAVSGLGDEVGIAPVKITELPEGIQEGSTEWLVMSMAQVDPATGKKVMDLETIRNLTGFRNQQGQALAEIIYNTQDPMLIHLTMAHTMGLPGASRALKALSASTWDQTERLAMEYLAGLRAAEPEKLALGVGMIDTMRGRISEVKKARVEQVGTRNVDEIEQTAVATGDADLAREAQELRRLDDEIKRLDRMDQEFIQTREMLTEGSSVRVGPLSADEIKEVDRILDDKLARDDYLARALSDELYAARDTLEVPLAAMRAAQGLAGVGKFTGAYNRRILAKDVRKATAKGEFQREGTSIRNKKRLVRIEETPAGPKQIYERDGWFSRSVFSPADEGRFRSGLRRNLRVWRYAGQATPSGWLGLKGTGKVGMQKELEAMMDIDLYRGEGVAVTGTTEVIGGTANRDNLINNFLAAFYDPRQISDPLTALKALETQILQDMARVYGMDGSTALRLAKFGQDTRAGFMDQIKQTGYFVDESGDINFAPWISEHAASGAQTLPFQAIEKAMRRLSKDSRAMGHIQDAQNFANTSLQWFNDIWRPATLMRASYTQRNVFEGLIRAMAYQNSLIPLTWPARAVANGMSNIRRGSRATKEAKRVLAATTEQRDIIRQHSQALATVRRYDKKIAKSKADGVNPEDIAEMEMIRDTARANAERLSPKNAAAIEQINEIVKGTRYGKWREDQLQALAAENAAYAEMNRDLLDTIGVQIDEAAVAQGQMTLGEAAKAAGVTDRTALILDDMQRTQDQLLRINESRMAALQTDLGAGLQEYMAQSSRSRHIGSGMSLGPDGNYYHDAWTGPLAQMNRQLMSSDNTVKQALVLQMNNAQNFLFHNVATKRASVEFSDKSAKTLDTVSTALAEQIDLYATNRLVQKMFELGYFDPSDAVDFTKLRRWVTETEEGRQWWKTAKKIFGEDNTEDIEKLKKIGFDTDKQLVGAPAERFTDPSVDVRSLGLGYDDDYLFDPQMMDEFFAEVIDRVEMSLWNDPELIGILKTQVLARRASDLDLGALGTKQKNNTVARQVGTSKEGRQLPAAVSIRGILERMDLSDGMPRFVAADEVINVTSKNPMNSWRSLTAKIFKYLGTIPEDSVVRGPFYAQRFKDARNRLIKGEMDNQKIEYKISRSQDGNLRLNDGDKIEHPPFVMTPRKLREIEAKAHAQALSDTREWMYTIERRTKLGKYGEYFLPFISAMQNSVTVMGKLIQRDPALPFIIAAVWKFPDRAGWTDEEGNIVMPIVAPGFQEWLNDRPEIPIFGGILDDKAKITIPKEGLNVIMPESGYGIVPRMTPLTTVAASEMMKNGLMRVETPSTLVGLFGKEAADDLYQQFKDYIFGEERGPSNVTWSLDKLAPAYMQKVVYSQDELSRLYGYQFSMNQATQMARYRSGERDEMPTVDEINKRTVNNLVWQALGNLGIPTPQTPYPILTRPNIEPAEGALGDIYRMYQQKAYATGENDALRQLNDQFGLWSTDIAQMKGSKGTGGANMVPETVTDIRRHEELIGSVSGKIGPNYTNVLGILVNNRKSQISYDPGANAVLSTSNIPGLNKEWRTKLGPNERLMEAQRSTGWMQYRQLMDGLDAELQARGLRNYQQKGAEDLALAKKTFILNAKNNPDLMGWVADYDDAGGGKTNAAITVMQSAINSEDYKKWMLSNGLEGTMKSMEQYLYYRNGIINILNQVDGSINNVDNYQIKMAWDNIRQELKNNDVRWAEIADLYLTGDDDPRNPGNAYEVLLAEQGVIEYGS